VLQLLQGLLQCKHGAVPARASRGWLHTLHAMMSVLNVRRAGLTPYRQQQTTSSSSSSSSSTSTSSSSQQHHTHLITWPQEGCNCIQHCCYHPREQRQCADYQTAQQSLLQPTHCNPLTAVHVCWTSPTA
jgi:hypothetical protein